MTPSHRNVFQYIKQTTQTQNIHLALQSIDCTAKETNYAQIQFSKYQKINTFQSQAGSKLKLNFIF